MLKGPRENTASTCVRVISKKRVPLGTFHIASRVSTIQRCHCVMRVKTLFVIWKNLDHD